MDIPHFTQPLQVITSQGSKPLHVKVDPGTLCSLIPLFHFCKAFPKHLTKSGALKKSALIPMWMTQSAYDGTCQNFLGYIVLDIHHKTLPQVLPCKFYVFENQTSPDILLSYPTSSRVGIVQFTVPNKVPLNFLAMMGTITNSKNGNIQQTYRRSPTEATQQWRAQNETHNKAAFPGPSNNNYTFTGLFTIISRS